MIILLLGILIQFLLLPYQFWADGAVRYEFVQKFLDSGSIESMKYSSIGPLLSLPFALLDKALDTDFFLKRYNFFIFYGAIFILWKELKDFVDRKILFTFILLVSFGSMIPGHLYHYYGEVFSAVLMAIGLVYLEKNKRTIGWLCVSASVLNTPATFIALLFLCGYKIYVNRDWSYFVFPILIAGLLLLESKFRMPRTTAGFTNYLFEDKGFETILPFSGNPGYSYPMLLGVLNQILSFGKGLIFFTPAILLLGIIKPMIQQPIMKRILILWFLYVIGLIFAYAKWWSWYGGWFWGPRFLLFATIPSSYILAHVLLNHSRVLWYKILYVFLTAWSLWVGLSGIIFQPIDYEVCTKNNYALEHLCWFVPEFSVLFHPFIHGITLTNMLVPFIVFNILLFIYITFATYSHNKKTIGIR